MSREKMVNYLEKRIQEVDRWLSRHDGVEPHEIADERDREDFLEMRGERKSLTQTLKYVKSVKFNDDYKSKPRSR